MTAASGTPRIATYRQDATIVAARGWMSRTRMHYQLLCQAVYYALCSCERSCERL